MRATTTACHLDRTNDKPNRKVRASDIRDIVISLRDIETAATSKSSSPIPVKKSSSATQMELKRAKELVMMKSHINGSFERVALTLFDPSPL